MMSGRVVLALAGLAAVCAAAPLTAKDLVMMRKVQMPVAAPDGVRYVVPVQTLDEKTFKKTQSLYMGQTSDYKTLPDLVPLGAQANALDSEPFWSKDGKTVLFLSSRSGRNELWAVSAVSGATAQKVTSFPIDIDSVKLSPDGSALAFSASVYPGLTMEQTAAKDKGIADSGIKAMKFDKLFIRRWDDWFVGKFRHVFVAPITYSGGKWSVDSAAAADLMPSFEGDTPSRPFGGAEEYDWAPDSKQLAFTTQIGKDKAWSTDLNVWTVAPRAGSQPTCVTCANPATDTIPAYSPDGKWLAYLSMQIPGYESDLKHVKLLNRATGEIKWLTLAFDRQFEGIKWSQDSKAIYGVVWDTSLSCMYTVDAATGVVSKTLKEHQTDGASAVPCPDDKTKTCFVYSRSDFKHPAEIYVTLATGAATPLTKITKDQMAKIEVQDWEEFWYKGANDEMIHSWIFKPYGYAEGKKFPLVLYVHGGPEDPWFDTFHYRWNPQTITAAGYAVLAPNFHGSASFGSNFTQAILMDWGGKPYVDLMKGVDAAVQAFPWIDGSRVGAMGASYGGFMINWLNTQTTRFKCLVCHDGLWDTAGQWYYTDELYFPEKEFGAPPFVDDSNYKKNSPSTYAAQMVTPELVIHGSRDYRIPDVAGISVFTNLQRRGIDSALILLPEENHFCLNPHNSIYWHTEVIAWLDKYLKV